MTVSDNSHGGVRPGKPVTDVSPEARRRAAISRHFRSEVTRHSSPAEIIRRVAIGTWNDGFIHAGNLAYMSLLAIFPFFILGSAAFSLIGDQGDRAAAVGALQAALPPSVGDVIGPAARAAIEARTGWLLWVGAVGALWTFSSLIETVRDILRRAYGTTHTTSFLWHRLGSTGLVVGATVLLLLALLAQVPIGTAQEAIEAWSPQLVSAVGALSLSRAVPTMAAFFAIYRLLYALAAAASRARRYPKWPGALVVTVWWVGVSLVFPPLIHSMFSYSLTYGSLAGIMIALFFFWLSGLGVVVGAELNAALTHTPEEDEVAAPGGETEGAAR